MRTRNTSHLILWFLEAKLVVKKVREAVRQLLGEFAEAVLCIS